MRGRRSRGDSVPLVRGSACWSPCVSGMCPVGCTLGSGGWGHCEGGRGGGGEGGRGEGSLSNKECGIRNHYSFETKVSSKTYTHSHNHHSHTPSHHHHPHTLTPSPPSPLEVQNQIDTLEEYGILSVGVLHLLALTGLQSSV